MSRVLINFVVSFRRCIEFGLFLKVRAPDISLLLPKLNLKNQNRCEYDGDNILISSFADHQECE